MISNQTLILIAIILMLVDIFIPTEVTAFTAYIIFPYLIAHRVAKKSMPFNPDFLAIVQNPRNNN